MILSHKHKFIFIKTNKTAGTSVEIALSKFCGPDDIITEISKEDEKTRAALGFPLAQNFHPRPNGRPIFYNHMSAKEVINNVGQDVWDRYYTFTIERNPWDRVISLYYWMTRSLVGNKPILKQFIMSDDIFKLIRKGIGLYTIEERVVVNKIMPYENLQEELDLLANRLRLNSAVVLPQAKSGYRQDKRCYTEVLDQEERRRISVLFKREIDLMGYQF